MARTPVEKYIWLIDLLRKRGRMTRHQINEAWKLSPYSLNGEELCRRTLYNYKNAILDLFDINIVCDSTTFEYYIDETKNNTGKFTEWLLNSSAVNEALSESREISDRILLEDVPSAREHLSVVFRTLKSLSRLRFDYHNYTRSRPTIGIEFEPYLARIFRQRWYVVGRNVKEDKLKTYALDRMSHATDTGIKFNIPDSFDPATYFEFSYGIVVNQSEPCHIVLRTDHHYAKYLAALPLHSSQQQTVHDHYCLFRYHMQITDDLVQELLSHGSRIIIEEPRELRMRIRDELKQSLDAYSINPVFSTVVRSNDAPAITDMDVVRQTLAAKKHAGKQKNKN